MLAVQWENYIKILADMLYMLHFAKARFPGIPNNALSTIFLQEYVWQTPLSQHTQLLSSLNSRLLLKGLIEHLGNNDLGKIKQFVNTCRPHLRA